MASVSCLQCFQSSLQSRSDAIQDPYRLAQVRDQQASEMRITAMALAIISIVFLSVSLALFGVGTLPPEMILGLGVFPSLAGFFLSAVGAGIFLGSVSVCALSIVRSCQHRYLMRNYIH